jgi:putative colanic acid biosynthesis glycosyltransferase
MNTLTPKITVITVTYNALDALSKTMRSVDAQDYAFTEYIIVDGGSTDGTREMLTAYKGRLDSWVSERDKGIYDAMNKGVGMAHGDYCIFMNAGDTFASSTVLSDISRHLDGSDVIYGDITKEGKVKHALPPHNCHKMFYCHQAAFVSTKTLREFPFDIRHRYSADFKQAKQMILAGRQFRRTDILVADFDTHGVSNVNRAEGLWDNIKVVAETDSLADQARLLPRLLFTYTMCVARMKARSITLYTRVSRPRRVALATQRVIRSWTTMLIMLLKI